MTIHAAPKPLVIKLGGSALARQHAHLREIRDLQARGIPVALVRGGGAAITRWLRTLNLPVSFLNGERVTDEATLEVVRMVLCGEVNQGLLCLANSLGIRAVGLCGTDAGGMIRAHVANPALGLVGVIDEIQTDLLWHLLHLGYLPLLTPLGCTSDGRCLNINADQVAAHLATALEAETLLFLSDVPGIAGKDGARLPALTEAEARELIQTGDVTAGMVPKVQAALAAGETVPRIMVVDGRDPHILRRALTSPTDIGTTVCRQDVPAPSCTPL